MNNRIKELRLSLHMNQEDFGKLLGITKSGVSDIESCRRKVTEQHIIMLKNHNVNESWLRTGEGDMFIELDKEEELMQWAGKMLAEESHSFKKRFVAMLMNLDENDWKALEKIALKLKED